jgi:TatD DNase family protein
MSLIDSHCHLDDTQFDSDRDAAVQRAIDAGVTAILSIGTGEGPPDLETALRLADRYDCILATAGIHPQYAPAATAQSYKYLADLLSQPKCVAVGEIGLDYHWEPYDKRLQADVFREQMRIAADARKPIIIHTRDAWADTLAALRQHWAPTGLPCIMHCFTGGPVEVREALDLGFYVSFAGVLTYPKAAGVQDAARLVPLDRLLVETDAPYLSPVPHRGKRNEPAYVAHTARYLARLRGEDEDRLAAATTENFHTLFTRSGVRKPISYTEGFE